jgi:hypothetical protein
MDDDRRVRGLLYTLLAAFSGVLVGRFLSQIGRLDDEHSNSPSRQDNTADKRQQGQKQIVRVAIESLPPSTTPPEQREGKKRRKNKRRIFANVVKVATIALLALVAFINGWQLHTQIRTTKIDNRPWFGSKDFIGHIHFPNPNYFYFEFWFINLGKSAALSTHFRMNYKIVRKGPSGEFNFTPKDIQFRSARTDDTEFNSFFGGTIPPNITWQLPQTHFENISDEEWKELLRGDKRFYFFEEITYDDVFGRHLYSHFCAYYPSGLVPPVVGCGFYNDTTPE